MRSDAHAAETIMLLHGNGLNSSHWGSLTADLNREYHLLLIDLKAGSEESISWDLLCEELSAVTTQLGLTSIHIISHAFGGSLGIAFAGRNSQLVKSLILISIVVFYPSTEWNQIVDEYQNAIKRFGFQEVIHREVLPYLTLLGEDDERVKSIKQSYDEMDERAYNKLFTLQMLDRPIEEARSLECPVLLLAGERDQLYLPMLQSITTSYFKMGSFLIVPNSANAVFIDQPQLSAQWMRDFIRKAADAKQTQVPKPKSSMTSYLPSLVQTSLLPALETLSYPQQHVLKLSLLHTFQVHINGIPVTEGWNKRYAKNIIAYLAMHPSCTREELCECLFPLLPRSIALNNVKVYLGHLKKLLLLPTGASLLQSSHGQIFLDAKIECDLQAYLAAVKSLSHSEDSAGKYASAQELLQTIGTAGLNSGINDPWFADCKREMEDLLVRLSNWCASWDSNSKA